MEDPLSFLRIRSFLSLSLPLAAAVLMALLLTVMAACDPQPTESTAADAPSPPTVAPTTAATAAPVTPVLTTAAPPTPRPTATLTPTPTPEPTATPMPEPTATPSPEPTEAAIYPLTVQATDGREVVFDSPPERIIAFDSAVVEILFAIGEADRIVATHDFVTYPPETESIARVGDAFNMNIEAAVALEPDLVFVFFDRFVEDLEGAGLKVLYIQTLSDDFFAIADRIRLWGRIVGAPESAEAVAQEFEDRLEAIRATMEQIDKGPTVFHDTGGLWTPGQGTLLQAVFDLLKLENIASDIEGYAQLSPELIVERNPEVIISGSPEGFDGEGAFKDVRAVQDGAIYSLSTDALSIASQRFVEGIEELALLIYPELFQELAKAA